MDSRHDQIEVKAYLLGVLSPDRASQLEQRYFLDREFFAEVVRQEEALIAAYLSGQLPPDEHMQFESRYLAEPGLARKVSQARTARHAAPPRRLPDTRRLLAAAAVIAFVALGLSVWISGRNQAGVVSGHPASPVRLVLTPGLAKGPGDSTDLQLPLSAGADLVLEIPGLASEVTCGATISRVDAAGRHNAVWSHRSTTAPSSSGQQLTLRPPVSVLTAGDYVIHVENAHATDTYVFRVVSSLR